MLQIILTMTATTIGNVAMALFVLPKLLSWAATVVIRRRTQRIVQNGEYGEPLCPYCGKRHG